MGTCFNTSMVLYNIITGLIIIMLCILFLRSSKWTARAYPCAILIRSLLGSRPSPRAQIFPVRIHSSPYAALWARNTTQLHMATIHKVAEQLPKLPPRPQWQEKLQLCRRRNMRYNDGHCTIVLMMTTTMRCSTDKYVQIHNNLVKNSPAYLFKNSPCRSFIYSPPLLCCCLPSSY